MDNERLMKAFLIINKYKDRILPPRYDFILDVPYETDVDKIENLKLIAKIPKPFHIQAFRLSCIREQSFTNRQRWTAL